MCRCRPSRSLGLCSSKLIQFLPLKARKLLATMKKKEMKEATFLEERLALLDHIETLQFGPSVHSLPMAEVRAHCQAIVNENLALPFDIRSKLLERYSNHYMMELKDLQESSGNELEQYLEKYIGTIAVWRTTPASADVDEMNLTASFIFEGIEEDISLEQKQVTDIEKMTSLPEERYKVRRISLVQGLIWVLIPHSCSCPSSSSASCVYNHPNIIV